MKHGMARAIEIVEQMKAISVEYEAKYRVSSPMAAEAFRHQVIVYQSVIDQLRNENGGR